MQTHCGYIALLGRPNAGKSTLLNACLGQKIVGVSKRPQTTRNRILGVETTGSHQLIFLDTPGMHKSAGQPKMNHMMNKTAWSVIADADIVCYLVDAAAGWHAEDSDYLSGILAKSEGPVLVIATKMDKTKKAIIAAGVASIVEGTRQVLAQDGLGPAAAKIKADAPFLLSAKQQDVVTEFKEKLRALLPEGPWLFAEDDITDKPERFIVGEMIREQVFRQLGQELPYGATVVVDTLTNATGKPVVVKATIITNKASHKPIIIGRGGQLIKKIGTEARLTLETHFGKKVFLELFVKVAEKWVDDKELISEYQQLDEQ